METITNICPKCHSVVEPTDYYCYNCGTNLKPAPPPVTMSAQVSLYLISFLLPPLGLFRGFKYLKQKENKYKTIGVIAVLLTLFSLLLALAATSSFVNGINSEVNKQLDMYSGGLY